MSILNYWPFKDSLPRKTQVEVLEWIEKLPSDIRYIICEIPVGGGKSPIALNVSGWLSSSIGNSFILTPQKILQKQYESSFPDITNSFYGKANYSCDKKGVNCEIGDLIKPRCGGECPHKRAYEAALNSNNLIMNYALAILYELTPANLMDRRSLMVFDECHNIEKQLVDIFGVHISDKNCRKYAVKFEKPKNIKDSYDFIKDSYIPAIVSYIANRTPYVDEIAEKIKKGENVSKDQIQAIDELEKTKKHLIMVNLLMEKGIKQFISEHVLIEHNESFEIKQLYARDIFNNFFDSVADKFLFLSSTILDRDEFCSDLGIDKNKTAFISMPSEFPVESRQIIFAPKAKMTYGWDKEDRKQDRINMLNAIRKICNDVHGNHNGVIHAGSYQVSTWLVRELEKSIPHKIYHHNADADDGREKVIADFQNPNNPGPKLLISPSVTEGLDLKDDLGRFSIIAKTPYPYLGDAWVKRRAEISQKWYMLQAMKTVIQASGRVVRSKEDFGFTYILDSSFESLYNRLSGSIPRWWKDAFVKV